MPILPLADLVAQISRAEPHAGTTRVVAIDGRAGAGKTVLSHRLAQPLNAPIVHMDDLFPGWDGLGVAADTLVTWVLDPLAAGQQAEYQRYDWNANTYRERVAVTPTEFLIVEGCASGSRAAAPFLSNLIWVEAPHEVRMARGLERDGETFAPHWQRWAAQEDVLYATEKTRERADVVLNGDPDEPHDPDTELVSLSIFA